MKKNKLRLTLKFYKYGDISIEQAVEDIKRTLLPSWYIFLMNLLTK
jgi:hypothetical protein